MFERGEVGGDRVVDLGPVEKEVGRKVGRKRGGVFGNWVGGFHGRPRDPKETPAKETPSSSMAKDDTIDTGRAYDRRGASTDQPGKDKGLYGPRTTLAKENTDLHAGEGDFKTRSQERDGTSQVEDSKDRTSKKNNVPLGDRGPALPALREKPKTHEDYGKKVVLAHASHRDNTDGKNYASRGTKC